MNNVVYVAVDKDGHMCPSALEDAIKKSISEGKKPFYVNATAGTTVLGVYDPIEACADVCKKYNMWLHVDGALGASALMSPTHKHLMKGVHRADSVTWCLHKMLGMNQQCSAFISRHNNILKKTNSSMADYLFHDHEEVSYDLGDKTLNCGRRQDSLKAWLSWQVHGDEGFQKRVDHDFDNAVFCAEEIKKRSDKFELLWYPECIQTCFFYLPKCIRDMPKSKKRDEYCGEIVPLIRRRIQQTGRLLVNYNPLHASPNGSIDFTPNFFRIVFANPEQTKEDVIFALDEIDRLGEDIVPPSLSNGHDSKRVKTH
jgi:glutamate/tyrosine decarboxylase-like PLP-dependent enzyme